MYLNIHTSGYIRLLVRDSEFVPRSSCIATKDWTSHMLRGSSPQSNRHRALPLHRGIVDRRASSPQNQKLETENHIEPLCLPVVPRKAVAEVSEKEAYRRVWSL